MAINDSRRHLNRFFRTKPGDRRGHVETSGTVTSCDGQLHHSGGRLGARRANGGSGAGREPNTVPRSLARDHGLQAGQRRDRGADAERVAPGLRLRSQSVAASAGWRRPASDFGARSLVALAALCAVVSCGDDDGERPPTFETLTGGRPAVGGRSGSGGRAANGGAGGTGQGGSAEPLAGQGGEGESTAGSAGAPPAEGGAGGAQPEPLPFPCPSDELVDPPSIDSVCSPALGVGELEPLDTASGLSSTLLGVSGDELAVVWSSTGVAGVTFFAGDRASLEEPFAPIPIELEGSVVALSDDGLRVVVVATDGSRYFEASREARGNQFSGENDEAFALLNAEAEEQALKYGGGALSADGLHFAYLALAVDGEPYPVRISHRDDVTDPWPPGEQLELCELEAHESRPRRPTAFSSDGLTLFFHDPERGRGRAAYRAAVEDPFEWFIDLEPLGSVYPNAACDRLYSSGVQGAVGMWVAATE